MSWPRPMSEITKSKDRRSIAAMAASVLVVCSTSKFSLLRARTANRLLAGLSSTHKIDLPIILIGNFWCKCLLNSRSDARHVDLLIRNGCLPSARSDGCSLHCLLLQLECKRAKREAFNTSSGADQNNGCGAPANKVDNGSKGVCGIEVSLVSLYKIEDCLHGASTSQSTKSAVILTQGPS